LVRSFRRLGDGGQDAGQHVVGQHFELVAAEAAHKFVGQVDGRELGGPGLLDGGDERRPVVGRLVVDLQQAGGRAVFTWLVAEERFTLAMAVREVRFAALGGDGVAMAQLGNNPLAARDGVRGLVYGVRPALVARSLGLRPFNHSLKDANG